jgi:hypothetical protein
VLVGTIDLRSAVTGESVSIPRWGTRLADLGQISRDKAVSAGGFGARADFGKRPAQLVIDVNWAFCGEWPQIRLCAETKTGASRRLVWGLVGLQSRPATGEPRTAHTTPGQEQPADDRGQRWQQVEKWQKFDIAYRHGDDRIG